MVLFGNNLRNITILPKRLAPFVLVSTILCTILLIMWTQNLNTRIREMEARLQSEDQSTSHQKSRDELLTLYKHYKSTGMLHKLDSEALNNTRHAGLEMVFFNRVPKVGSQSFSELQRRLSLRNNFQYIPDLLHKTPMTGFSVGQQEEYADMLSEVPMPCAFPQHMCFVNFTKFNRPRPIYVNMVRDPVSRIHSWFYYIRSPWYYVEMRQNNPERPLPTAKYFLKDFDTCVLEGNDPECSFIEGDKSNGFADHRRQTVWFCGHDPECRPFNTQDVLERSKHAVETQYAVVGVLEDMKTTLAVFEKYIPRFFAGASEIYFNEMAEFKKINQNKFKPPVSEEVKQLLRKNFTREIEFYEFCKRRLQNQFLAANLNDYQ